MPEAELARTLATEPIASAIALNLFAPNNCSISAGAAFSKPLFAADPPNIPATLLSKPASTCGLFKSPSNPFALPALVPLLIRPAIMAGKTCCIVLLVAAVDSPNI